MVVRDQGAPLRYLTSLLVTKIAKSNGSNFAYTQVCTQWRQVALRTPRLWSRITKDLTAPQRSLSTLYSLCDVFQKGGLFPILLSNMYRVRSLWFHWAPSNGDAMDPIDRVLAAPAPMLEEFSATDEEGIDSIDWVLADIMFSGVSPNLHTVDLPSEFRFGPRCSLLQNLCHLRLGTLTTAVGIVPMLARTPSLATLKFEMFPDSDDMESIEEVMADLA